ncbi:MAG: LacI family DNA-binding transcriptional regulator [Actinomycetales bacterium]
MIGRRATSADVARRAGVSRTTVSYVLNGRADNLPVATQARVRQAAADLHYVPSAAARTLRRGRSDLVVLMSPRWTYAYTTGVVVERLTERVDDLGLCLMLTQADAADDRVWASVAPLAVVSLDLIPAEAVARLHRLGVQHVIHPGAAWSVAEGGARHGRVQAEYLIGKGHRRFGFACSNDPTLQWFSEIRSEGFRRAITGTGEVLPLPVGTSPELAVDAVQRWQQAGASAVAAYNDETAIAVLGAMQRLGLTCPDDLAVMGVDNSPASRCVQPGLTTLDVAPAAAADLLGNLLARSLGGDFAEIDPFSCIAVVPRESA